MPKLCFCGTYTCKAYYFETQHLVFNFAFVNYKLNFLAGRAKWSNSDHQIPYMPCHLASEMILIMSAQLALQLDEVQLIYTGR